MNDSMNDRQAAPAMQLCAVYRSEKKEGAYLYTEFQPAGDALEDLPEALLHALQPLTEVMKLKLTPERKLANADASRVLAEIAENGYYLQMPPVTGVPGQREEQ